MTLPSYMTVEMPDGSVWGVPVQMIAQNRAAHYAHEFDGDVDASYREDTAPLFSESPSEIRMWATGNMDWKDFEGHQVQLNQPKPVDYQEGWLNGDKGLRW